MIRYADGEQHTFTYDTYTVNHGGDFVIVYHRPSGGSTATRGYELRFTYQSNTGNTSTWRTVATAAIYSGGASSHAACAIHLQRNHDNRSCRTDMDLRRVQLLDGCSGPDQCNLD